MPSVSRRDLQKRLSSCTALLQWIFIGSCLIFLVLGLAILGVGGAATRNREVVKAMRLPGIETLPAWGVTLGVFVTVLAVLAACGAFFLHTKLMATVAVLLSFILVMQIGIAAGALSQRSEVRHHLITAWNSCSNQTKINLEKEYECCGMKNYTDMPALPCPDKVTRGCLGPFESTVLKLLKGLAGVGIVLAILEVSGIATLVHLISRVRKAAVAFTRLAETGNEELNDVQDPASAARVVID
eukprot:m51a1_g4136 hypothetical protein (242) ;mRNA; f:203338-204568